MAWDYLVALDAGQSTATSSIQLISAVVPPATATWGAITGILANQIDLQAELDTKGTSNFSGAYADLSGKPTLGTAAATASTDYASAAQGAKADSAVQPARTVNGHALSADVAVTKTDVGLSSVDNTSDAGKPVSTAQQAALDLKANLANPTLSGVTLANATDVTINAATGSTIGQSGSKIGFFGVTPVVRPTAITQTYATASATQENITQLAAPAGGTGTAAGGWSTAANRNLAITSINAARTDIANVKQVLNQVIDQLQALGILQ